MMKMIITTDIENDIYEKLVIFLNEQGAHPYMYPQFFQNFRDSNIFQAKCYIGLSNSEIIFFGASYLYKQENIIEFPFGPIAKNINILTEGIEAISKDLLEYKKVRIQPYIPFDESLIIKIKNMGYIETNKPWQEYTVDIDLVKPMNEILSDFNKTQRRLVRYAQKNEYTFVTRTDIQDCQEFVKKHNIRAEQVGYGKISNKYLEGMLNGNDGVFTCMVCELRTNKGVLAAGALVMYTPVVGWYQRGYTNRDFDNKPCSSFLHYSIIAHLKSNNLKKYDLAGIQINDLSGVSTFKKSLNANKINHKIPQFEKINY